MVVGQALGTDSNVMARTVSSFPAPDGDSAAFVKYFAGCRSLGEQAVQRSELRRRITTPKEHHPSQVNHANGEETKRQVELHQGCIRLLQGLES